MQQLVELVARVAELERRVAQMMRHGTVEDVDPAKHRVRIRMGEDHRTGKPYVGPWVPYAQIAGGLKVHAPPTAGQQMTMLNPTGDPKQGVAIPLTWSEANASPSAKGDENVLSYGNVRIELRDGQVTLAVGDAVLDVISGKVALTVGGAGYELDGSELKMTTRLRAKGGSRAAHYVGGRDSDGDRAVDGNDDVLI